MDISIKNAEQAEMPMLITCIERARQHRNMDNVVIHVARRGAHQGCPQGWIEYLMIFTCTDGRTMTVGAIQRSLDAEIEFHS